jgi:hypothetical protein|tara:strand:+ start:116 stop:379 length:264 start_codon:yes stop_codon:yes gene_type:complete
MSFDGLEKNPLALERMTAPTQKASSTTAEPVYVGGLQTFAALSTEARNAQIAVVYYATLGNGCGPLECWLARHASLPGGTKTANEAP